MAREFFIRMCPPIPRRIVEEWHDLVVGEIRKEWMSKNMPDGISLVESHMNRPRKLGFLGTADLLSLTLFSGKVPWLECG